MQEYASTVKSTDVGLPWEVHFKAKKNFESTDLKKIFQFCVEVFSQIIKSDSLDNMADLMKYLLTITENILTWGYISSMHILDYQIDFCGLIFIGNLCSLYQFMFQVVMVKMLSIVLFLGKLNTLMF